MRVPTPGRSGGAAVICIAAMLSAGSAERCAAGGPPPPSAALPSVQFQPVATITRPVLLTFAPGDPTRKFIVELGGQIRLVKNGTLLTTPFLNIAPLIAPVGGDRGLKCIAFHPNYQVNGFFYIVYMDTKLHTTLARYKRSTTNSDLADPASAVTLLSELQPDPYHNGNWLGFGPDGYLYFSLGEGTVAIQAQDLDSIQGKILRLDVNGALPYAIPPTNPFVGRPGRDEIWASGLRNPWRLSFDRLTGDLWIADVGEWLKEEINFQPASSKGGENYGWNCMEADLCHWPFDGCHCDDPSFTSPMYVYPHSGGAAVVGGYVYRGAAIPNLAGWYVFADVFGGKIITLNPATGQLRNIVTNIPGSIYSLGQDFDGELYFMGPSQVRKIVNDADCDDNGIADAIEIAAGTALDCNHNGLPDFCDIALDNSLDENHNGIPDECENDCNLNGIDDLIDISMGVSADCNGNSIPDECDIAQGALDCDSNGVPDMCQIAANPALDADGSGIMDSCEAIGDLNGDGRVNTIDLGTMLISWSIPATMPGCAGTPGPCTADLNHDGHVNSIDLAIMFVHWSL